MVFTILIWETRFRHLRLLDDRLFPQIPHHAVKSLFSHRPFTVPQAYKDLCLNFSAETKIQSKVILKDTFRIIGLTLFYVYNRFCIKKDKNLLHYWYVSLKQKLYIYEINDFLWNFLKIKHICQEMIGNDFSALYVWSWMQNVLK